MKLKEVCERTGLSRKTIRLYEEKELFCPQKERRNGREYRDYTEEDVQTLLVIASLRKAWFTMDEIRRMQNDPAEIQTILPQYKAWLLAQKSQLDGLLSAAEEIDPETVLSIDDLSARMEPETKKLSLPPADIRPRFQYLDAMDTRPERHSIQDTELQFNGMRVFWAWPHKTMSQKLLDDTLETIQADANGPVKDREPEKDPLLLRIIQVPLLIAAFGSFAVASLYAWGLRFHWKAWLIFAISGLPLALISYRRYRREQRAWIQRISAEKQQTK